MIFLTSNLGASEMTALSTPQVGFSPKVEDSGFQGGLDVRMARVGVAAARRRFTPEFVNRLDKIVVFKPLGEEELHRILDIELSMVQQRLERAATPFDMNIAESAREMLLREGFDSRYGARHLKRAIERLLVQPLANLLASGQIRSGDSVRVSTREDLVHSRVLPRGRGPRRLERWRIAGRVKKGGA